MKRQTEKKLTQAEIIDRLISITAHELLRDNRWLPYLTIDADNRKTIEAMIKRGILQPDQYNQEFKFTPDYLAKVESRIRERAKEFMVGQYDIMSRYRREEREHFNEVATLRFVVRNATKEYWSNTPEFTFINWRYIDANDKSHNVHCNYQHDIAVTTESELQITEARQARAEIGSLTFVPIWLQD